MENDFNFKQVPRSWAICYVADCPRKAECLRYQACLHAPDGRVYHKCILPTMLKQDGCSQFRPMQKIHMALGFRNIFNEVKAKDIARMRAELTDFLGSTTSFYRYRNGINPLTPLQQQWIRDMFHRYGYSDDLVFDGSKDFRLIAHSHCFLRSLGKFFHTMLTIIFPQRWKMFFQYSGNSIASAVENIFPLRWEKSPFSLFRK